MKIFHDMLLSSVAEGLLQLFLRLWVAKHFDFICCGHHLLDIESL
jgi:hypothetical protein